MRFLNFSQLNLFKKIYFLDPRLKKLSEDKMVEWRQWFDSRLDNAIEATEIEASLDNAGSMKLFQAFVAFFAHIQE